MAVRINADAVRIADRLARVAGVEVKTNAMIAPYTSYKIGGPTAVWAAPGTESGAGEVLAIVYTGPRFEYTGIG